MMHRRTGTLLVLTALGLLVNSAMAQVQHGKLDVVELNGENTYQSVDITRVDGYGDWVPISSNGINSSSRGDYFVTFNTGDDTANGVLIVGPYEDERVEASVGDGVTPYFATVATARAESGNYYIPTFHTPGGYEVNYNVALAYFPIEDGWICGGAYNSANGDVIDEFVGHPDIVLTNPFDPNEPNLKSAFVDQSDGDFLLRFDGIDMRRDGVLIANGAKNEDNYVALYVSYDGTALLNNRDNNDNNGGAEQDPVAFCFVTDGTAGVTMGRITGSGRTIYGQGNFTVTLEGAPTTNGTFRLAIDGEGPDTGTLIVTPYTELSGNTADNPAFVVPQADGTWLITSRDIASMGLQDLGANECAFHFVFFKDGVDIVPGTPAKSYLTQMNKVVSARVDVTEIFPDNGNGDMMAELTGSSNLRIAGENRGDVGLIWLDARPRSYIANGMDRDDGVWLGNSTEFIRDNTATGGTAGWATVGFDNGIARTHAAVATGGEFNSNFALAMFPKAAGFQQDADVAVVTGGSTVVNIDGDSETDGVLIAINWDNNNRYVTAQPNAETNGFVVGCFEGIDGSSSLDWDYGYVYLPYTTPGLIAGWIDEAGNVLTSSGTFTVGTSIDQMFGLDVTTIAIPGVDAQTDGVLILTSTEPGICMAWEAGPNGEFEVAGFNPSNQTVGRYPFYFAFVDYDSALQGPGIVGDIDDDGDIDLDDYAAFANCMAGPGVTTPPDGCSAEDFEESDFDVDGDVDLADFAWISGLIG